MIVAGLLACAPAAAGAATACAGRDLMADVPPARMAEMQARADAVPYAKGLFWQAKKEDARIILAGTYHFGDERHDAAMARLRPVIAEAGALLVEAGPQEEARLTEALRTDPALMADPAGAVLPGKLGREDWQRLSAAMQARGVPPETAARLRPWYLATMLGLSPCMLRQAADGADTGGLDRRLIDAAKAARTPIRALEPWDTLFSVFAGMTPTEQLDMLRAALPQAEHADDYATTLTNAYFAGNIWLLWEFGRFDAYDNSGLSRAEVDKLTDLTQRQLMDNRNRAWIRPLTQAAEAAGADGKPVVAAFGALHLPGEAGVLRLLERDGWTITPLGGTPPA